MKWAFKPTLANFVNLVHRHDFFPSLWNSFLISASAVVVAIVVSFLAAYCFSRFKPRATNFLMFLLLSIRMVPAAAVGGADLPHVHGARVEGHVLAA